MSGLSAAPSLLKTSGILTLPTEGLAVWAHGLGRAPEAGNFGAHFIWKGGNQYGFQNGDLIPIASTNGGGGWVIMARPDSLVLAIRGPNFLLCPDGLWPGAFEISSSILDLSFWARA